MINQYCQNHSSTEYQMNINLKAIVFHLFIKNFLESHCLYRKLLQIFLQIQFNYYLDFKYP